MNYKTRNYKDSRWCHATSFIKRTWKNLNIPHHLNEHSMSGNTAYYSLLRKNTGNSRQTTSFVKNSRFGWLSQVLWLSQRANGKLSRTYFCECFVTSGVFLPKPLTLRRCKTVVLPVALTIVDANQETQKPARNSTQKAPYEIPSRLGMSSHPFQVNKLYQGCWRALPSQAGKRLRTASGTPPWPNTIISHSWQRPYEWNNWIPGKNLNTVSMNIRLCWCSSVKLRQHIWNAKAAHCTAACLSKSHPRRTVKQPGFLFSALWKTAVLPLWITPAIPNRFLFLLLSNNSFFRPHYLPFMLQVWKSCSGGLKTFALGSLPKDKCF